VQPEYDKVSSDPNAIADIEGNLSGRLRSASSGVQNVIHGIDWITSPENGLMSITKIGRL
jgi:hypothetical protein